MKGILFRTICRAYLVSFIGIFLTVLAIFLVADFVDRAKAYTGPNWMTDVAILYLHKAVVATQQLAPAAMLLAAGVTVSTLRKRGEVTALQSLGFGPASLYVPILLCASAIAIGLILFDERVVTHSSRQVDEITVKRFNRWGDWRFYFTPKQWFRRGDSIFYLRGGDVETGFADATVLKLTPEFELERRIDAGGMHFLEGTRWRLTGVQERTFLPSGELKLRTLEEAIYDFGVEGRAFRIRAGRPEQMRLGQLEEQILIRAEVGLVTRNFELALHNRFAYPLAGIPAALLAVGLALRPGRKGHLTKAMVEGLFITMALYGLMVVFKTLVTSERVLPAIAAWLPTLVLLTGATALWARREGLLPWRRRVSAD